MFAAILAAALTIQAAPPQPEPIGQPREVLRVMPMPAPVPAKMTPEQFVDLIRRAWEEIRAKLGMAKE